MNQNTVISWVTTGIGIGAGAALDRGFIDANTATTIGGAAATLIPLIWGLFIHRDSKVVQTASQVQGLAEPIKIASDAPAPLLALAKDASVPNVKPEVPERNPYATQRMRT
jgi:hypothetical protein